jgi:hypothetical protein
MAMFDSELNSITEDDLLSLVENQVREGTKSNTSER